MSNLLRRSLPCTHPNSDSCGVPRRCLPGHSVPETPPESEGGQAEKVNAQGSDGGAGTSTVAVPGIGEKPVRTEEGLSPVPSAKDFCFVKAILHLPDEDSRPSVSNLALSVFRGKRISSYTYNHDFSSLLVSLVVLAAVP